MQSRVWQNFTPGALGKIPNAGRFPKYPISHDALGRGGSTFRIFRKPAIVRCCACCALLGTALLWNCKIPEKKVYFLALGLVHLRRFLWCPSGAAPYLGERHLNTHLWFSLLFLPAPAIPGYPGESAAHQEWLPGLSLLLPTARQISPSPRSEQARIGFAKFVCVVPYDAYYQCFRSCLKWRGLGHMIFCFRIRAHNGVRTIMHVRIRCVMSRHHFVYLQVTRELHRGSSSKLRRNSYGVVGCHRNQLRQALVPTRP